MTDCSRLAKALSEKRCRHGKGFRHGDIAGAKSPRLPRYPIAMCETIASAWYPKTIFGHVPAMPCIPVPALLQRGPGWHRTKDQLRRDFADVPLSQPAEVLDALTAFALPAEDFGTEIVSGEAAPPIFPGK